MPLGVKAVKPTISDLVDADSQVIALEAFFPIHGRKVERGYVCRLGDVAPEYREYFALIFRLAEVTDIERIIER
jgi:hypothetical protein